MKALMWLNAHEDGIRSTKNLKRERERDIQIRYFCDWDLFKDFKGLVVITKLSLPSQELAFGAAGHNICASIWGGDKHKSDLRQI